MSEHNDDKILEFLAEKFGIEAEYGKKFSCVECHHETMEATPKGFAKCFHVECGLRLLLDVENVDGFVNSLIAELLRKGSLELASPENSGRKYLQDRRTNLDIISITNVASVPADIDWERWQKRADEIDAKLKSKEKGACAEILKDCRIRIEKHRDWLAFLYLDETHRFVGIRFRIPKLHDKKFSSWSPNGGTRGLFVCDEINPEALPSEWRARTIVVEGEFNALSLLSMFQSNFRGNPRILAIGSATNKQGISQASAHSNLLLIPDNDSAGETVVKNFIEHGHIEISRLEQPHKDIDDLINGSGNHKEALSAVTNLLKNTVRIFQPSQALHEAIYEAKCRETPKHARKMRIVSLIKRDLLGGNGRAQPLQSVDGEFVFLKDIKKLCALNNEDRSLQEYFHGIGLLMTDEDAKDILEDLRQESRKCGERVNIHKYVHYSKLTNAVYLANGHAVYKISKDRVEICANGTDGVLFYSNTFADATDIDLENPLSADEFCDLLLGDLSFGGPLITGNSENQNYIRFLILAWLLSTWFPELLVSKALLVVQGEKGSGKTIVLQKMLRVLFGPTINVVLMPSKPDDFDVIVCDKCLTVFDNVDTVRPWLADKLATVATGGYLQKRKLYTNHQLISVPVLSFVALTTRNPSFNRDDVADRTLLVELNRLPDFSRNPEKLLSEINELRPRLLATMVHMAQDMLRAFEATPNVSLEGCDLRSADFASVVMRLGSFYGVTDGAKGALSLMRNLQAQFTLDDNPIKVALDGWFYPEAEGEEPGTTGESGMSATELFDALLAHASHIQDFPKSPRSFAALFAQSLSELRSYYEIREEPLRSRKKVFHIRPRRAPGG